MYHAIIPFVSCVKTYRVIRSIAKGRPRRKSSVISHVHGYRKYENPCAGDDVRQQSRRTSMLHSSNKLSEDVYER